MGIAALATIGIGLLMIVTGVLVSLTDWRDKRRKAAEEGRVKTDPLGLAENLGALQKLAEALKGQPLGFQLIILGMALITIGGLLGSVAAL